jgi:hypothetical protein
VVLARSIDDAARPRMVAGARGSKVEPGGAVQAFAESRRLMMESQTVFRARIRYMISGSSAFYGCLWPLVFIVASLGTINTLTMNVLEQTREIAVSRTVELLGRPVSSMIQCLSSSLALASLAPEGGIGPVAGLFDEPFDTRTARPDGGVSGRPAVCGSVRRSLPADRFGGWLISCAPAPRDFRLSAP